MDRKQRVLVVCPTGSPAPDDAGHWRNTKHRDVPYDIVLIKYREFQVGDGELPVMQRSDAGNKWELVRRFLVEHVDLWSQYAHVGFVDDDLVFTPNDLTAAIEIALANDFQLYQMSMSSNSECSYSILFNRPELLYAKTNFVEIMAPFVSTEKLPILVDFMGTYPVSTGWGIDLVLPRLLSCYAYVVHASSMYHPPRKDGSTYDKSAAVQEQRICLNRALERNVTPAQIAQIGIVTRA